MSYKITTKEALLSVLYVVLLLPFSKLLELGYKWLSNNVVLSLINWFNHLNIVIKILLIFFQAVIILTLVLGFFKAIGNLLSLLIFNKLPDNYFTVIFSLIIYVINVVLWVKELWEITPAFDLWIFLEFCMLVWFILSINTVLLPWYVKHKAEKNARERMMEETYRNLIK